MKLLETSDASLASMMDRHVYFLLEEYREKQRLRYTENLHQKIATLKKQLEKVCDVLEGYIGTGDLEKLLQLENEDR